MAKKKAKRTVKRTAKKKAKKVAKKTVKKKVAKKAKPRKGTRFACWDCGTQVIVDCCGVRYRRLVCCGKTMKKGSKK